MIGDQILLSLMNMQIRHHLLDAFLLNLLLYSVSQCYTEHSIVRPIISVWDANIPLLDRSFLCEGRTFHC
ncbi:unnamed protein product [Staurois parvus]|uniref:Uncharacterized protein n=1 Tax=Staurois parvus TaxID=386267 RepID=A0ABN9CWQ3_9NEOB|nr:unnamed protein product [Staurois parvus]